MVNKYSMKVTTVTKNAVNLPALSDASVKSKHSQAPAADADVEMIAMQEKSVTSPLKALLIVAGVVVGCAALATAIYFIVDAVQDDSDTSPEGNDKSDLLDAAVTL